MAYNKEKYRIWFETRGREVRQKYNKEYSARPEVIERAKERNARPHIKARRKMYKKTPKGRITENKYRRSNFHKDAPTNKRLQYLYGITLEKYNEMIAAQKGVCLICNIPKNERLHVDHCHKTKNVRGLLCGSCNRMLGLAKDDTMVLMKAIQYLSR
jgi:hypothetical protein